MPKARRVIPGVDPKLLIKDAARLIPDPSRRLFLRGAASLGAITSLTGCDIVDEETAANPPAQVTSSGAAASTTGAATSAAPVGAGDRPRDHA